MSSRFNKNVLTLATGVSIGQTIPLLISPILTRIYTPEDFGILALFLSISTLISVISSGRYEQAIMLPDTDEEAMHLTVFSWIFAAISSLIMLLAILLFHPLIMNTINNQALSTYIYFTPLLTFLLASFNILNILATRLHAFSLLSKVSVIKSMVNGSVQLISGALKGDAFGLILGQILGSLTQIVVLFTNLKGRIPRLSFPPLNSIKTLLKRYKRFPQFSVAAVLSNTLTQNVLNISISSIFSVALLGYYSFANRILILPMSFLGNSIGQVFFQEATSEKNESGSAQKTLKSTFWKLTMLSIVGFGLLYFIIEDLFSIVFGKNWEQAGLYARYLIPMMAAKFVVSPLSAINNIFNKQYISLTWQVGFLTLTIIALGIVDYFGLAFSTFINIYALVMALYYLLMLPFIFTFARGSKIPKST
ncbi:MAG: oligosaccharide flippase family protein [FCB group bacterium]|nr:oligosaccharide flippase family protein [FCB group bacterium]MBL7028787.1 oligosaccharide flippase family protein [Candidatus Neomarinimicrobiota bacterium]MBL7121329.1 oligosaccharide flippase family protein [Candidatus Neomarinimicrobiota bacterium]